MKHSWTKQDLTVAYYIAKWDLNGLGISKDEIIDNVIGDSTVPSLNMQVANFRYLLGIEGYQLEHASEAMKDLVDELQNKTVTQVRAIVNAYIDKRYQKSRQTNVNKHNRQIEKKREELNEFEQRNHKAKLEVWKKDPRKMNLKFKGIRKS